MRNALLTHPSLDPSLRDVECVLHRHMCVSLRGCGGKMTECAFSLVITRQRLRGESEICSKHSTFNRRQRASSRRCNHQIIYFSFYMLFVVRSRDLFLRPVLFGGFPTAHLAPAAAAWKSLWASFCHIPHKLNLLALKERQPLYFVYVLAWVVARVCFRWAMGERNWVLFVLINNFFQRISFHVEELHFNVLPC